MSLSPSHLLLLSYIRVKKTRYPSPSEVKMEGNTRNELHPFLAASLFASLPKTRLLRSLCSCLLLLFSASVFVSSRCCHGDIHPKHQTKEQLKTFTVCCERVRLRNGL